MTDDSPPTPEYEKEVRLAIVMYGGVSLAIYINGITQELLRLVRSTAANRTAGELAGTELIYRKVAWLMGEEGRRLDHLPAGECIQASTRFIIDIISGTSAGGINGIFLAKALANDQDLEKLKQLWIKEGDLALLINDKKSHTGEKLKRLRPRKPPESLLNGQRMYLKLLDAFTDMDETASSPQTTASPNVEDLDLYVTTTDIEGIPLPIRLADKVVYERRHRNVFHFAYSSSDHSREIRNDFVRQRNPFLAFAARCTSSFPFAFEPMKLSDIDKTLELYPHYRGSGCGSDSKEWEAFYQDYVRLPSKVLNTVKFKDRAFGDGGYLDNKPFSYSIETLMKRQSEVPGDRKLFYIEPSPDHPELDPGNPERPDVARNVAASLVSLPRYETIREDLKRVLERNRLLTRVKMIVAGLERDVEHSLSRGARVPYSSIPDQEWARMDLADLVAQRGHCYIGYHRLLITAVSDDLAQLIIHLARFNEHSDYVIAVRCLIRAWRGLYFSEYREADRPETLNAFALEFDLGYPLRRLSFLLEKMDDLYRLNPADRDELRVIRKKIVQAWRLLLNLKRRLHSRKDSPLLPYLQEIVKAVRREDLDHFLCKDRPGIPAGEEVTGKGYRGLATEAFMEECEKRAADFIKRNPQVQETFNTSAAVVRAQIREGIAKADQLCRDVLGSPSDCPESDSSPRADLSVYFASFDIFDMITFPILYETGVGATDNVEVFRMSPEDATALIDERAAGCVKLAGSRLGHFGAFLEQRWRENDILWGRLDGVERIVSAMLPGHPDARQLIGEAQGLIMCETLEGMDEEARYGLLAESLMRTNEKKADAAAMDAFIRNLKDNAGTGDLRKRLDLLIDDRRLRHHYQQKFKQLCQPPPEETLRSVARATTVVGQMLEGLSDKYGCGKKYAAFVARFGRVGWGLVEVSVPQSISNLLFRHWLFLLYLVEVFLILGGILFEAEGVKNLGWKTLIITLIADGIVLFLNSLMCGKGIGWWRPLWRGFCFVLVAAAIAMIVYHLPEDLARLKDWIICMWQGDRKGC